MNPPLKIDFPEYKAMIQEVRANRKQLSGEEMEFLIVQEKVLAVAEAGFKLREHWHGEGHGRYACAGEADFLEALAALESDE